VGDFIHSAVAAAWAGPAGESERGRPRPPELRVCKRRYGAWREIDIVTVPKASSRWAPFLIDASWFGAVFYGRPQGPYCSCLARRRDAIP